MKSYELKIKTVTGRIVTKYLGNFNGIEEAITDAINNPLTSNLLRSDCQSFTVQEYKPKVSARKNIQSRG